MENLISGSIFEKQIFLNPTAVRLRDVVQLVSRRKCALFLPLGLIFITSIIIAVALPPYYKSTATILIEEQEIPSDFVMATVTSFAEQRLQVINQRIMSYSRLLEIINRFSLYPELQSKWTIEEIVKKMREDIALETISTEVIDRLTHRPTNLTIAFTLSYTGKDPEKVQQVVSTLSSFFLEENLQVRTRQTMEASRFLEDEMNKVKADLNELNQKISNFKEKHINALPEFFETNLQLINTVEQDIDRMNAQLQNLKERESYLLTQLSTIPSNLTHDVDRQKLEELKIHLITLKTKFTDDYPDVIQARAQIEKLEERIRDLSASETKQDSYTENPTYVTIASQLAGVKSEIDSVEKQILSRQEKRKLYQARIEATPGIEGEYNALLAERNSTNQKYNDLLRKLMEANVAHGLEKEQKGERFTLIDPARYPEKPFKPNRLMIFLIGIVFSLLAGIGSMLLFEITDDSAIDERKIFQITGIPVLAGIPVMETIQDIAQKKQKRTMLIACSIGVITAGILYFHFFVMHLDIFWIKLIRRLAL